MLCRLHRLRRWKFPCAVKEFLSRLIELDDDVPGRHDRSSEFGLRPIGTYAPEGRRNVES